MTACDLLCESGGGFLAGLSIAALFDERPRGNKMPDDVFRLFAEHGVCVVLVPTSDASLRGLGDSVPSNSPSYPYKPGSLRRS